MIGNPEWKHLDGRLSSEPNGEQLEIAKADAYDVIEDSAVTY